MPLNNYLEHLQELPLDLQRNLTLLRDLDSTSQSLVKTIESDIHQYIDKVSELSADQKSFTLQEVSEKFSTALKQGEDKVSLAAQTYNLADQCIRQLDQDLLKFETEELVNLKPIKVSFVSNQKTNDLDANVSSDDAKSSAKKRKGSYSDFDSQKKKHKKKLPILKDELEEFHEMPIDPDEPIYCFCNRVSFGEMVACDNESCTREWFHYSCVGLKTQPRGKWYCSECQVKVKPGSQKS